jgi:uncharacterized protein YjbI with pentapeptide repeats
MHTASTSAPTDPTELPYVEARTVPDDSHIALLRSGVDQWNRRRVEAPFEPHLAGADLTDLSLEGADLSGGDLRGSDLSEVDCRGADLHDADLTGADMFATDLRKANLKMATLVKADLSRSQLQAADLYKVEACDTFLTEADLSGAYLVGADLARSDLRGAILHEVNAQETLLRGALLQTADLRGANLTDADISDAHLNQANLEGANLFGLTYGSFRSMTGHFYAIRGLATAHGNALFVRDAQDQDYLETLRRAIDDEQRVLPRAGRRLAFSLWSLIDYGRSLGKLACYALLLALGFGLLFWFDRAFEWGLLDHSGGSGSSISPFYFSVVTYTTLGFGDITPAGWQGELLVILEVILGYTTLGLLLSILANRVARRA